MIVIKTFEKSISFILEIIILSIKVVSYFYNPEDELTTEKIINDSESISNRSLFHQSLNIDFYRGDAMQSR